MPKGILEGLVERAHDYWTNRAQQSAARLRDDAHRRGADLAYRAQHGMWPAHPVNQRISDFDPQRDCGGIINWERLKASASTASAPSAPSEEPSASAADYYGRQEELARKAARFEAERFKNSIRVSGGPNAGPVPLLEEPIEDGRYTIE